MSSFTPVKVRGKRKASDIQQPQLNVQTKDSRGNGDVLPSPKRRRKQHDAGLSRLQQLPAELIQEIFTFSGNPSLPFTCRQLHEQLSGSSLHDALTDVNLAPVLEGKRCVRSRLTAASRLMNSRFFTYEYFHTWLLREFDRRHLQATYTEFKQKQAIMRSASRHKPPDRSASARDRSIWRYANAAGLLSKSKHALHLQDSPDIQRALFTWAWLAPCPRLIPPKKLLFGPFTADRLSFLELLTVGITIPLTNTYPSFNSLLQTGIKQAASEGSSRALQALWPLGVVPETGAMRHAIEAQCSYAILYTIADAALGVGHCTIDYLDPAMWRIAEAAQSIGDPRGAWLKDFLRHLSTPYTNTRPMCPPHQLSPVTPSSAPDRPLQPHGTVDETGGFEHVSFRSS